MYVFAATQTSLYIYNMILGSIFTSYYPISVIFRQLLALNSGNLGIMSIKYYFTTKTIPNISFVLLIITIEVNCYFLNIEKVKLFLEKEKSVWQEAQQKQILRNIPVSVFVLNFDKQVVFKNQEFTNLLNSVVDYITGRTNPAS
jgi:hypothetical protein